MADDDHDPGRPAQADWLAFASKLDAVMNWPLLAEDPECVSIFRILTTGPEPDVFARLMTRLAERGVELASARYGRAASAGAVRRGPEQRLSAEDDGPPARVMLRL